MDRYQRGRNSAHQGVFARKQHSGIFRPHHHRKQYADRQFCLLFCPQCRQQVMDRYRERNKLLLVSRQADKGISGNSQRRKSEIRALHQRTERLYLMGGHRGRRHRENHAGQKQCLPYRQVRRQDHTGQRAYGFQLLLHLLPGKRLHPVVRQPGLRSLQAEHPDRQPDSIQFRQRGEQPDGQRHFLWAQVRDCSTSTGTTRIITTRPTCS